MNIHSVRMTNESWFPSANKKTLIVILNVIILTEIVFSIPGAFYSQENVGNYEVVIDISAVSEFFTNSYDVS